MCVYTVHIKVYLKNVTVFYWSSFKNCGVSYLQQIINPRGCPRVTVVVWWKIGLFYLKYHPKTSLTVVLFILAALVKPKSVFKVACNIVTDFLKNVLTDWLTDWLIPSDKHNFTATPCSHYLLTRVQHGMTRNKLQCESIAPCWTWPSAARQGEVGWHGLTRGRKQCERIPSWPTI